MIRQKLDSLEGALARGEDVAELVADLRQLRQRGVMTGDEIARFERMNLAPVKSEKTPKAE